jgi:hypothetical protein
VPIDDFARRGLTRGDPDACDHDLECKAHSSPCGIVEEDTGQLRMTFGSSDQTSACIVDGLTAQWPAWDEHVQAATSLLQITRDNSPESRGRRTQFLHRMVQLADEMGTPIQRLSYPPYHSQYHPIERCWGLVELHWNGTKLMEVETMLEWAQSMTWKGIHPVVALSRKIYDKGIAPGKAAMQAVENRLERHPELPKWDIMIHPASTS